MVYFTTVVIVSLFILIKFYIWCFNKNNIINFTDRFIKNKESSYFETVLTTNLRSEENLVSVLKQTLLFLKTMLIFDNCIKLEISVMYSIYKEPNNKHYLVYSDLIEEVDVQYTLNSTLEKILNLNESYKYTFEQISLISVNLTWVMDDLDLWKSDKKIFEDLFNKKDGCSIFISILKIFKKKIRVFLIKKIKKFF
jgi:hypothetical protein